MASSHKDTRRNKERGIILTIFLSVVSGTLLYNLGSQLLYFFSHLNKTSAFESFAIVAVAAVGIYLMWQWKKLGVYLYCFSILLFIFVPPLLAVRNGLPAATGREYFDLISAAFVIYILIFFILRPKWHSFS